MLLSIIIVSYNTKDLTFRCLQSLYRAKNKLAFEVIVVDNASTDQSSTYLTQTFPDIKLIQNQKNYGFGYANNQAAQIATGEYLLFLNSDTEILGDSLQEFISLAQKQSSSIASCCLVNLDRSLQPQGGALPNLFNLAAQMLFIDDLPLIKRFFPAYQRRSRHYFTKDQHPGWVAGTAILVKKSVFSTLGGFNQEIFMYGEDVDLCFRARRNRYRIDYFAAPQICHLGQGSGQPFQAILGELKFLKYYFDHYKPAWQNQVLKFFLKTGCLLRVGIFGMIGQYDRQKAYQQIYRLV